MKIHKIKQCQCVRSRRDNQGEENAAEFDPVESRVPGSVITFAISIIAKRSTRVLLPKIQKHLMYVHRDGPNGAASAAGRSRSNSKRYIRHQGSQVCRLCLSRSGYRRRRISAPILAACTLVAGAASRKCEANFGHGRKIHALSRGNRLAVYCRLPLRSPLYANVHWLGQGGHHPVLLPWLEVRWHGSVCGAPG